MGALRAFFVALLVFALGAEALFRALPVSTATRVGYHVDPFLLTYPPQHRWMLSFGWDLRHPQRLRANNLGFVAARDFVPDARAVALVGDSFVEAASLPATERPDAQLERALGDRPVYALGGPGSSLLDYAERIRFAHERFGVRDFVVLMERGDVLQALCGSGNVHARCLDRDTLEPRVERQPPPSGLKRVLRESAFAQYVAGQLQVSPQRLWANALAQAHPAGMPVPPPALPPPVAIDDRRLRQVDAVAAAFFAAARPHVEGRLVIVVDSDRARLRRGLPIDDAPRERFLALARAAGAEVVDTQTLYAAHYASSPLSLDVSPRDSHFNALGVRLVMEAAARVLTGRGTRQRPRIDSTPDPRSTT